MGWLEFSRAEARTGRPADPGRGGSDGDAVVAPLGLGLGVGMVDAPGEADADGVAALGAWLAAGAQATTIRPRRAVTVTREIEVRMAGVSRR